MYVVLHLHSCGWVCWVEPRVSNFQILLISLYLYAAHNLPLSENFTIWDISFPFAQQFIHSTCDQALQSYNHIWRAYNPLWKSTSVKLRTILFFYFAAPSFSLGMVGIMADQLCWPRFSWGGTATCSHGSHPPLQSEFSSCGFIRLLQILTEPRSQLGYEWSKWVMWTCQHKVAQWHSC